MANAPVNPISSYAYDICQKFNQTCTDVEKARNEDWKKNKSQIAKISYYALQAFTYIGAAAAVSCLVLAAVNFSLGYLGGSIVAAVAAGAFAVLKGRFGTFGFNEEINFGRFKNPLGLFENKDSVPAAGALKEASAYFAGLVPASPAAPKDDKAKVEQENKKKAQEKALEEAQKFFVNQKLFDKTFEGKDLSARVVQLSATLAVTGYTLAAIQDIYNKDAKKGYKDAAEKAAALVDQSDYSADFKAKFKPLLVLLQAPTDEFQKRVAQIASEGGKPKFKMADLDLLTSPAKA